MSITFEIFPTATGYGYIVYANGAAVERQLYAPGLPGFVEMTEAEATAAAEEAVAARTAAAS